MPDMELDDLKATWQQENQENLHLNKKNMEELQLILKNKTKNTLTGIKGKYERIINFLFIGVILNIIINPFLHFLLGDGGQVFRLTFGGLLSLTTIIVVCFAVILFYWIKYKSIEPNVEGNDIKNTINDNINRLRKSLRQEILFIIALVVSTFIAARASSQFLGNGQFEDIFRTDIILSILVGFSIMGYYIYKRTIAYKKHIQELHQYLTELD
jgi:hypothetical protein